MIDWIAAGALGVAAISLILNFLDRRHERSENYRAALYAAQLSAVRDLLQRAGAFHHAALRFIEGQAPDNSAKEINDASARMDEVRSGAMGVLPERVGEALLSDVARVLVACFEPSAGDRAARRLQAQQSWDELITTVRHELGTASLGPKVRELTGVADRTQKAERARK